MGAAGAVKYGEVDGDAHPYGGLMVALNEDGAPMLRCSGTLIAPTLFLTDGHCAYGAAAAEIWLTVSLEDPNRAFYGYPFTGEVSGTPYNHPDYSKNLFILADVGVVVLDQPVILDTYGVLPEQDVLDQFATRRGQQNVIFTAVGYSLQLINPVFIESELIHMSATPRLLQINVPGFTGNFSLLLFNNRSTGGTCFGDSGGPSFFGDTNEIAGVTSFAIHSNCASTGGVFRLDRAVVLDWLYQVRYDFPNQILTAI